jgi:homoserine/homoserine lactone efflux protein
VTLAAWLYFCATEALLCVTPGPAVLLVVSQSLASGVGSGLRAALGILAANAGYFFLSAIGVGAALVASYELFFAVKWLGVVYLVWLGLHALLRPRRTLSPGTGSRPAARPFLHGVVTQGANPKVILFFTALLPQFVSPESAVAPQIAILGASSIAIELAALSLYAGLAARARRAVARPGTLAIFDRASGVLLLGAGAGLATLRRAP